MNTRVLELTAQRIESGEYPYVQDDMHYCIFGNACRVMKINSKNYKYKRIGKRLGLDGDQAVSLFGFNVSATREQAAARIRRMIATGR